MNTTGSGLPVMLAVVTRPSSMNAAKSVFQKSVWRKYFHMNIFCILYLVNQLPVDLFSGLARNLSASSVCVCVCVCVVCVVCVCVCVCMCVRVYTACIQCVHTYMCVCARARVWLI